MLRHIFGSVAMGFGGVITLGCTIGQCVTGMSTRAVGSLLSLTSIIFGNAMTMKVEYYRLHEQPFFAALDQSLTDMNLIPGGSTAD